MSSSIRAQQTIFTLYGDAKDHLFGGNVSEAGDVDADGYQDFVIGAPFPVGVGRVRVHSGRDGRVLHEFVGTQAGSFYGVNAGGAGDVNADGHDDIIVGDSQHNGVKPMQGQATVYSGKDGKVLYKIDGDGHDLLGTCVSTAGDINKDGYDDFIVGAVLDDDDKRDQGSVRVYSGKDGKKIYHFKGDDVGDALGVWVCTPGDIDKDGYPDILCGAYLDDHQGKIDCGSARLYSGKDGTVIHTVYGDSTNDQFGRTVSGAGDVNKDGYLDFIVGAPFDDNLAADGGMARLYSGKDFSVLHTFNGAVAGDWFGWTVSGGGDVNADGYADVMVGSLFDDTNGMNAGSTFVYSGKDYSVLYRFDGEKPGDWSGQSVAMMGDVNDDGHADLLVGAERNDEVAVDAGTVYLFSGKQLTLWSDVHALSINAVGQQKLSLDVGPTHSGRSYWIFGSVSGTHPGTPINGVTIPLRVDSYTRVVMVHTNGSLFSGFRGQLDSFGRASASINIPAALPASPDFTLYHAALVFDANGVFYTTSNPTSLHLHN